MPSAFAAAASTGAPAFKFEGVGSGFTGVVVSTEEYQPKEFGTETPKTTSTGKPVRGVRVTYTDDDGSHTAWLEKWGQLRAVGLALQVAGLQDLLPGDTLSMIRTGTDAKTNAHTFNAEVTRPDVTSLYDPPE